MLGISNVYASNIDSVKSAFLRGDYEQTIKEGERLMSKMAADSRELDELYYMLSLSYMKSGNFLRASDIFEIIINELKASRFKEEAYLGLGDVEFLQDNFDGAQVKYKELLDKNPHTKLASLATFKLAQCSLKKGEWQRAKEYLEKLDQEFPLSLEAKMAKSISSDKFYFTVQVGSFSSYENANSIVKNLSNKSYSAYVEDFETGSKKIYRVRVGKLVKRSEALDLEKRLNADGFPTRIFP